MLWTLRLLCRFLSVLLSQTLVHFWLLGAIYGNCLTLCFTAPSASLAQGLSQPHSVHLIHLLSYCTCSGSSWYFPYPGLPGHPLKVKGDKCAEHLLLLPTPLLNYKVHSCLGESDYALGSSHHVTGIGTQDDTYGFCPLTCLVYHSYFTRITLPKQRPCVTES